MRTTQLITSLFALTLAAPALGACDAAPIPSPTPGEATTLRPGGFGCSWCTLTGNSPIVNSASLADINLAGVNSSGVKISGIQSVDNIFYTLAVDPDTEGFMGVNLNDVDDTLTGFDVLQAKILLQMNGGGIVYLEITDIDVVESWANSGSPVTVYRASYTNQGQQQSLCPHGNPENQWFTVIADELYDPTTHAITPSTTSLTIACVGQAAAKLKMLDYHPRGNYGSSLEQRETTLRMITADYCGTGQSFTAQGVRVAWSNEAGTVEPPFNEDILEAKWGRDGALCLDYPREVSLDTVLDVCELPSCDGNPEFEGAEWRTMLPID